MKYGQDLNGAPIAAPPGWKILPEGEYVPHIHREYIQVNYRDSEGVWAKPRRCHSTMTAIHARVWGCVRAYAVPESASAG